MSPISHAAEVTSLFGWRTNPITHQREFHRGIDLSLPYGYPVGAFFEGQIVWARPRGGYGNCVIIKHDDKRYTLYGHLSQISVEEGQEVQANELIGYVGSTGMSTGPHLHLEYWVDGQYVNPLLLCQTPKSKQAVQENDPKSSRK
jgi:lysostaphin